MKRRKKGLLGGGVVGNPPTFQSAELGSVNGSTIVVTFSTDITASNYATGVTIKVNNVATTITSATRQTNHAIVRYVIPIPWHGSGDTLTWEYDADTGNIVGESGAIPLADVSAQAVTNNTAWAALLDLQADTLGLSDGDPVSTWADQSGYSRDFTQSDTARPVFRTNSGNPFVKFDGVNDWMLGPNFADNLSDFLILLVIEHSSPVPTSTNYPITKMADYGTGAGWTMLGLAEYIVLQKDGGSNWIMAQGSYLPLSAGQLSVVAWEVKSFAFAGLKQYLNGALQSLTDSSEPPVSNISTTSPVRLGSDGALINFFDSGLAAVMIIAPAPSSTNRAVLETRLGVRYGITVP